MLNVKLLDDTLAWAEAEWEKTCAGQRSEWDQRHWVAVTDCGTTACMAGHIVITELGMDRVDLDVSSMGTAVYQGDHVVAYYLNDPLDGLEGIGNVAAHLLGLDDPEWVDALFYDATTIEHVRDVVAEIKQLHSVGIIP